MSKKISKALLPTIKEKINTVEILPVEINGEEFEVKVYTFLSTEVRDRLMKNIQLNSIEENVENFGAEILGFYSIFQAITDIDFPESVGEGIELFNGLSDLGIIAQLVEKIPEKMFNDITNALDTTREILENMSEVEKNEVK